MLTSTISTSIKSSDDDVHNIQYHYEIKIDNNMHDSPVHLQLSRLFLSYIYVVILCVLFHSSSLIEALSFSSSSSSLSSTNSNHQHSLPPPAKLKQLLEYYSSSDVETPLLLPCCYDGLTARLVARAGFEATFMTGFGVSAAAGYP